VARIAPEVEEIQGMTFPFCFKSRITEINEDRIRIWWDNAPDINITVACGAKVRKVSIIPAPWLRDYEIELRIPKGAI